MPSIGLNIKKLFQFEILIVKKKYKYLENSKTLNSRISYNNTYGNFNLFKWIDKKFKITSGQNVLDLGCGDGRYTKLFLNKILPDGHLISVDKNLELVENFKEKFSSYKKNIKIINKDFDKLNWKLKKKIDWFFSIYSIQYTKNFNKLFKNIFRIMKSDIKIVIIGPGKENALDINKLHQKVFGVKVPSLYKDRMQFIEKVVYPILKKNCKKKKITLQRHNYTINFPDYASYANYYWSTPLWVDELIRMNKLDIQNKKKKTLFVIKKNNFRVLKKQTVSIFCR